MSDIEQRLTNFILDGAPAERAIDVAVEARCAITRLRQRVNDLQWANSRPRITRGVGGVGAVLSTAPDDAARPDAVQILREMADRCYADGAQHTRAAGMAISAVADAFAKERSGR